MSRGVAIAAVLLALALPATASAATRYAAPGGGTVPGCVQASPCSLQYAITGASSGDEVVVTPGNYFVSATISAEKPLWIHGQEGGPRPQILGMPGVTPFKSFAPQHLSYLMFQATDSFEGVLFLPADGTVMERLELIALGEGGLGLRAGNNFTLIDSEIWAGESPNEVGLFLQGTDQGAPQLRNDTIVAAGNKSVGISIFVTKSEAHIAMSAINVIASGATDAEAAVGSEATGATAAIAFDHSNLDTSMGNVTSTNGQTAPPLFLSSTPPPFLQAPGSPTIDAGVGDILNGLLDLEGNPRALPRERTCGGSDPAITDIGAYEFVPAPPTCVSPPPATAPETAITRFKLRSQRATIRFTATGTSAPVSFECKLDRKPFAPCSSPKVYKRLKPGKHVFKVRAVAGGLVDPTAAKRRFRVKPKHHRSHHHNHHHGLAPM